MPSAVSSFMSAAEIEEIGRKMFEEITAVYDLLAPAQLAALRSGDGIADATDPAERLALRALLSYTQARFCRLNVLTPEERDKGDWMPVRDARGLCHVFGNAAEDGRLMDEAIELNLLPVFECEGATLVDRAVFGSWHDATAVRVRAGRPDTIQYGFHWVREEAA